MIDECAAANGNGQLDGNSSRMVTSRQSCRITSGRIARWRENSGNSSSKHKSLKSHVCLFHCYNVKNHSRFRCTKRLFCYTETDRQKERQTERKTDRQADRQTEAETKRERCNHIYIYIYICMYVCINI